MAAKIYYDGQCPFCSRYTALLRLRQSVGDIRLVNVREDDTARQALQAAGFDLDQGMVLDLDGRLYAGADAMHMLAMLGSRSGLLNTIVARVFRVTWLAKLLYPVLRAGRALTLFAMGRERISASTPAQQSLFMLFSQAWGLCAFLHLLYYMYYEGATQVFLTTWAIGLLGAYLTVRPRSPRAFVVLSGLMLWDAWAQMPVYSNHTILRNFTLLAIAASAIYTWARGRSWSDFMKSFAPVGRCLLAIMYVFGVFHKLNTDFIDPSVSCAVAVWEQMPTPLNHVDWPWFHLAAIHGTLIGETVILLGLLYKPSRQIAIILGIAFHSMLALSSYGFYPSFSTLAVALHLLFLSPQAAARITSSKQWLRVEGATKQYRGFLYVSMWFMCMWLAQKHVTPSAVGLVWLPWAIWIMVMVVKYGKDAEGESTFGAAIFARPWLFNLISAFFFFNCFAPYLGLKTAQSMNMFANLALEGGYNNHLVLRGTPGPFEYTNDVVKPLSHGSQYLTHAKENGLHLTYYDLLNQLERDRSLVVSFERNGTVYTGQSYATLKADAERLLHPRWFRNWFLFRPIDMRSPKPCSLSQ
ncbi:DCC1-like thiol-disulfide oxidoreductase family protein [Luteimonas sp. e5]